VKICGHKEGVTKSPLELRGSNMYHQV